MRLPPQAGERLDRERPVAFTFEGRRVVGWAGDTVGSALYAAGQRVFSRSFKYHRRRGLLCCSGACPNCLIEVDGVPNVRACLTPLRDGADVRAQNVLGSLDRDALAVVDRVGERFTPVGFYYRTLLRPRRAWPLYESVLRRLAGLGRVDEHATRTRRYAVQHARADVLVVGGGDRGLAAAREWAAQGAQVLVVHDDHLAPGGAFDCLAPATALGVYEGGLVPVDAGDVLYRVRAGRIVVAAGSVEQPLLFAGNDLVGVMLPQAVERLVRRYAIRPGERAVVVTADDRGVVAAETLRLAGTDVARVVDLRERTPERFEAKARRGCLAAVELDGERVECDLVVMSGGAQPAYSLLAQAGARVEYDGRRGVFVPRDLPADVEAELPDDATAAAPELAGEGKCFVCVCEDVTTKDVRRAVAEGFDSLELAKRYTTVTMGPCQGRLCQLAATRLYARETGTDEGAIGTVTARPPWSPVALGLLAAGPHEPTKRTSLHHRHEELGAEMLWAGPWRRPASYGDAAAEARAVHEDVGVIDVSTLGKLVVDGPDAVVFLERVYSNRFRDLVPGRVRYGVLSTDGGRIMDDGTIARLADDVFYVTTTSTGAESVREWLQWWNAAWAYDLRITDVTGALAALNVAGPRSRELLRAPTAVDLDTEAFPYLGARRGGVAGVACLLLRIGFVGELGYELHFAAPHAEHVWDRLVEHGARPFGVEAQRVLRLEKMHVIVGQDTDTESNVLDAGMPWIAKLDKDDFVGRSALVHAGERVPRERLVGFELPDARVPAEGSAVVVDGRPAGRVTSARWSEQLERAIGLAWVPAALAEEGAALRIAIDGSLEHATVRLAPFFDPDGGRLRS